MKLDGEGIHSRQQHAPGSGNSADDEEEEELTERKGGARRLSMRVVGQDETLFG